jgi:hypothetical protein
LPSSIIPTPHHGGVTCLSIRCISMMRHLGIYGPL